MPKVEHWFKQDLKNPVKVHSLNGSVFTLDNVGSVIGVEVFDSGNPVALTGTVNGYVILPDDTTISVVGTRSNNKASINLPQSALAIPGFIKIAVKLTNSSEITTLLAVVATVYKSRTDTIITPSQQIITDWSQQIAAEMQAVEDASAAQDAKIDDLKSAFNTDIQKITGNSRIPVTGEKQWIDLSGNTADVTDIRSSNAFNYSLLECEPGNLFTINGQGGTYPKAYAFIAENGTILEKASTNNVSNKVCIAPPGSAYLVIHYAANSTTQVSYYGDVIRSVADNIDVRFRTAVGNGSYGQEQGGINGSGAEGDSTIRLRTGYLMNPYPVSVSMASGFEFNAFRYGNDLTYSSSSGWSSSGTVAATNDGYVRLVVRKSAGTDIAVSEFNSAFSSGLSEFFHVIPNKLIVEKIEDVNSGLMDEIESEVGYFLSEIRYSTGAEEIIFNEMQYIVTNTDPVNMTPVPSTTVSPFKYAVIACSPGDKFLINGKGGEGPRLWCFVDSLYNRIGVSPSGVEYFDQCIIAPEGAAYCIINTRRSYPCYQIHAQTLANPDNYADFNLNINLFGLHDMCWEYQNWVFPQCVSCNRYRNQLLFGFVTGDTTRNYTGIASYDFATKEVTKTILKINRAKDDHNLTAVRVLSTGKVLCAYSDGHNDGYNVFIRISKEQESIDRFEDAIKVPFEYKTSYAQVFEFSGNLYLFTREVVNASNNTWRWAYKISEDFGETWGEEQSFITANTQYYIQLTETNTPGVLMLCCYSNPAYSYTDIRVGYLHLDTLQLYQSDNSTLIGTTGIPFTDINIAVSPSSGKRLRLFNGLKADVGDIKFLYCEFTYNASAADGVYYVYDNGSSHEISIAGSNLLSPGIQLGIAWIDSENIAVARGGGGKDYLEIYSYNSQAGEAMRVKQVDMSNRENGVRVARPMVDQDGRAIIYWKGFFNSTTYTDFFTDGRVYELESEP